MRAISHKAAEKIIREAGAERISKDARETLSLLLEKYGLFLASEAKKMSDHSGRKTLRGSDLQMAADLFT